METLLSLSGLLGLWGLCGLISIKHPVDKQRSGFAIRVAAIFGLLGFFGIWVKGAGMAGALGALGLYNHQAKPIAKLALPGFLGLLGLPFIVDHLL